MVQLKKREMKNKKILTLDPVVLAELTAVVDDVAAVVAWVEVAAVVTVDA
jgi:hypothetical protein